MQYTYDEEQQLFKDYLRKFVDAHYTYEKRCAMLREGGEFHAERWRALADLGMLSMLVPAEYGGLGFSLPHLAAAMEEFGRGLVLEPFLASSVLAASALEASGNRAACRRYLPLMAAGTATLRVAWDERAARGDPGRMLATASAGAGGYVLKGEKLGALDCPGSIIAVAGLAGVPGAEGKLGMFLLEPEAPGVTLHRYAMVDGTRAFNLQMDSVRVAPEAVISLDAGNALSYAITRAVVAVCAQALGTMDVLMSDTAEYCKTRTQFGVALGAFQALQHRLADMFIHVEKSRSLLWAAVNCESPERLDAVASALKASVGESARFVGQQAVQLHGGIAMTDELRVGACFKSLTAIELMFGNRDYHLSRLGARSVLRAGHAFTV